LPGIEWKREQAKDERRRELLETVVEEGLEQLVNFATHTKNNQKQTISNKIGLPFRPRDVSATHLSTGLDTITQVTSTGK
jgi:hypothetical protein